MKSFLNSFLHLLIQQRQLVSNCQSMCTSTSYSFRGHCPGNVSRLVDQLDITLKVMTEPKNVNSNK